MGEEIVEQEECCTNKRKPDIDIRLQQHEDIQLEKAPKRAHLAEGEHTHLDTRDSEQTGRNEIRSKYDSSDRTPNGCWGRSDFDGTVGLERCGCTIGKRILSKNH